MVQQMVDPATSDVTDVNTSYDAGVGAPAAAGTPADKFKIHSDPSQGPAPAASAITVTTADPAASTDDPGPEPPGPWSDAIGDFFAGDDDDDANLTPCACHFTPTSPAGVESLEPDTPFAAVDHQTSAGLLQQCKAAEVIRGPMSLRMPGVTQSRAWTTTCMRNHLHKDASKCWTTLSHRHPCSQPTARVAARVAAVVYLSQQSNVNLGKL